jgi:hypothetical protein
MKHFRTWILFTVVASSTATYLVTSGTAGPSRALAAAPDQQQQQQQPQPQGTKLIVDERDIHWNSVNAYRLHTTSEEVVLDLGFNMLDPNSKPGDQQTMLFHVPVRNVMSYPTAKRLQQGLSNLIQKYEATYGPITPPAEKK